MVKIEALGHIENGKLIIENRKRFDQDLRLSKDRDVKLIIKDRGYRSNKQNRYYFGVVVAEIRNRLVELGHARRIDSETVHEFLKQRFNYERLVTPHGEVIDLGRTTTEMNKPEFNEFIEAIRQWAAESLDLYIPEPGEQTAIDYD